MAAASPKSATWLTDVRRDMTWPTLLTTSFCAVGGAGFGVDYGYWSGVLGLEQFARDFGVYDSSSDSYSIPSTWQSAGSGPPIAGLAMGAMLTGFVGNKIGRLWTFRMSSVLSIVGIIVQATSMNSYWQIVVGRIINSMALGILSNTIPAYLAEVSPLSIRGGLVNFYQFSIAVGALLVNTCTWGMQYRKDQWAYRLTIIVQIICPAIFLPWSFFIPESPRWLIGKGRRAEAEKSLAYLRSTTSREVIQQETQLIAAAEEDNKRQFGHSWIECLKGSNLRRTLIATGVQCFQQAQGSSYMSSYMVLFFKALGIKDVYMILVLYMLTMTLGAGLGFYFPDRVGRRYILFGTSLVLCIMMYIIAGVKGFGLENSLAATRGAMACLFIWQFAMTLGWSSTTWMVTAEVSSLQLREKTITIATFTGYSVSIMVTFVSPFMQDAGYGNLQGRMGFVWGSFSLVAALWTLLYVPETGFRSLEEIDELFQNKVSVWKFDKYHTTGFGAQVAIVEHMMHKHREELESKAVGEEISVNG